MNIKELREKYGMDRPKFAKYFNLPYRTLQNWELDIRKCPDYLLELMEYKLNNEKEKRGAK
jgi:DNA-binding transcriptional regulator YiaG